MKNLPVSGDELVYLIVPEKRMANRVPGVLVVLGTRNLSMEEKASKSLILLRLAKQNGRQIYTLSLLQNFK